MIGVTHKHRYFRIQVLVSVAITMAVYMATKHGLIGSGYYKSIPQELGVGLFTLGPPLASCVLIYFLRGSIEIWPTIGAAMLLFAAVLVAPMFIAANDGPSRAMEENAYFALLHFIGILIFAGVTAWMGKLLGVLTLLAMATSLYAGQAELILFAPVLSMLTITNVYAQWVIAIVISLSSLFADR